MAQIHHDLITVVHYLGFVLWTKILLAGVQVRKSVGQGVYLSCGQIHFGGIMSAWPVANGQRA